MGSTKINKKSISSYLNVRRFSQEATYFCQGDAGEMSDLSCTSVVAYSHLCRDPVDGRARTETRAVDVQE